jgi:hypothetical protein
LPSILRQAEEGTTVGEMCRKAGISEATYYNWRNSNAARYISAQRDFPFLCSDLDRLWRRTATPSPQYKAAALFPKQPALLA